MSKSTAKTRSAGPSEAETAPAGPAVEPDLLGNAARNEQLPIPDEQFPFQDLLEELFDEDFSDLVVQFSAGLRDLDAEAVAEPETLRFQSADPDLETVAHELAHVVQFRRHGASGLEDRTSEPDEAAEREADRIGRAATQGTPLTANAAPEAGTMRKKKKKAEIDWAKNDKYNDADVNNNHPGGQVKRGRPGVTAGKGGQRDDTFQIGVDRAPMHFGNGEVRTTIGRGVDVCVNPASPRKFGTETCLLLWTGTHGAGWVAASAVFDGARPVGTTLIGELRGSTYEDWRPEADNFKNADKRMRFKSVVDGPDQLTDPGVPKGTEEHVFPNQGQANHTTDHMMRKGPSTGPEDNYYNVFMNLPQSDAAAVAHDVVQPGEYFWVVKVGDDLMKRTVDTFAEKSIKHGRDLTFVFGYVGTDQGPDKKRRGWVAWPVLEET